MKRFRFYIGRWYVSVLHCWFDFEDGHTCMLEDGHDGPHQPTRDDEIGITFNTEAVNQ